MSLTLFLVSFLTLYFGVISIKNSDVVYEYVQNHAKQTFRPPKGYLRYPYLVPAGPYEQMWDWDSVFMGTALLSFGSSQYLAGSMKNFFDHVDINTGEIGGCLTPDGPTPTIQHAKPVLIQGAWIVAQYMNDTMQFYPFDAQMDVFLNYFVTVRKDPKTGLYVWYDQLESGADNLVVSQCPSKYSDCWINGVSGMSLSSTDMMTFLYREVISYSRFLYTWALNFQENEETHHQLLRRAVRFEDLAREIADSLQTYLWDDTNGLFVAYNTTLQKTVTNRVFLMCFPVFGGLATPDQRLRCLEQIIKNDMFTPFGIRSTSSLDPRYNNDNVIIPYSNWRGPVWVVANALLAYGFNNGGIKEKTFASLIAQNVVATLANDIVTTNTWHECYDSENGTGLAAPGFLSWNTLGATLQENIANGVDPFSL